jgi:hypothetical protein
MKREPAVIIGILASALYAAVLSLTGSGVIGSDVAATIGLMIDPAQGGWLLPIIVALITRIFVSPAERPGL